MPAYGLTSRCVQNSALPFFAGCIHRQERKRTSAADCGLSEMAGAGAATSGVLAGAAACGSGGTGGVPLLKSYPNGLLQRA